MPRILRRFLSMNSAGHPVVARGERLTDDGRGHMSLTSYRTFRSCPGCNRPIEDVSDLRGRCDYCRQRGCCTHCETRCQACSRRLCVACRRGFAGRTTATVCPICLVRLQRRQAFEDKVRLQDASFCQRLAREREWLRRQALRVQARKARRAAAQGLMRERARIIMAYSRRRNRG